MVLRKINSILILSYKIGFVVTLMWAMCTTNTIGGTEEQTRVVCRGGAPNAPLISPSGPHSVITILIETLLLGPNCSLVASSPPNRVISLLTV